VRLLYASGLEVFEDDLLETAAEGEVGAVFGQFERVDQLVVFVHAQHAVRAQALDGEGAGYTDLLFVLVGLVVEVF
jgi:hypothetical protein